VGEPSDNDKTHPLLIKSRENHYAAKYWDCLISGVKTMDRALAKFHMHCKMNPAMAPIDRANRQTTKTTGARNVTTLDAGLANVVLKMNRGTHSPTIGLPDDKASEHDSRMVWEPKIAFGPLKPPECKIQE
jgi:hypothetical protein